MAPEDRRAALIAATVPLLHEHGLEVSTRQIAEAAGVAEGTIFGVFPDKGSLIHAALLRALDPQLALDSLRAIGPEACLRDRLSAAAEVLLRRFADNATLMGAARGLAMSAAATPELHEQLTGSRNRLLTAVTAVIEADAAHLRRSPATAARLLVLVVGATTYGMFAEVGQLTGDEMADLLLHGLLVNHCHHEDTAENNDAKANRADHVTAATAAGGVGVPDHDDRGGPVPC